MAEIKTETPTDVEDLTTSEWMQSAFDQDNLKKAAALGEILPKLDISALTGGKNVANGTTVNVEFTADTVKRVKSEKFQNEEQEGYFADVLHEGVRKSMPVPKSLGFSLAKILTKDKRATLRGLKVVIGANIQDILDENKKVKYKDVKLYWAQKSA